MSGAEWVGLVALLSLAVGGAALAAFSGVKEWADARRKGRS